MSAVTVTIPPSNLPPSSIRLARALVFDGKRRRRPVAADIQAIAELPLPEDQD